MVYLLFSGVFAGIAFAMSRRVVSTIIAAVLSLAFSYMALPVLNFGFWMLPTGLLATVAICLLVEYLLYEDDGPRTFSPLIGGAAMALLFVTVIPFISGAGCIHHARYRALLGEVNESAFSTDTAPVDLAHVRIVDQSVANRLGDKKLGEDTALGSQVTMGEMHIQRVGNDLFWVAPLNHSGFFKWTNSSGTPGYIMVSATNERDARLIEEVDGEKIQVRYNFGAFFSDRPDRRLYQNGYATTGLTDFVFEVDDEYRPYWVATKYRKRIGYWGDDATGAVVMDAQTGDIKEYALADLPEWVDRIQPESFIADQLNSWGRYVHGWWNLSHLDMLKVTSSRDNEAPTLSLVYGHDGHCYWYTGMTSTGADDSTVGFVLVNSRTKETKLYKQAGATEVSAMHSAEGAVQEKGYQASAPILYNISGVPTYFMPLKDDAGLVKAMAFVSVENYNLYGLGNDVQSAVRAYRQTLSGHGNEMAPDSLVELATIEGLIVRVSADVSSGKTYYYLMVGGYPNKAFLGTSGVSEELPLSREGDRVRISYEEGRGRVVDITTFDNLDFQFQENKAQQEVTERVGAVREEQHTERLGINADVAWENMTPEEKSALMKKTNE